MNLQDFLVKFPVLLALCAVVCGFLSRAVANGRAIHLAVLLSRRTLRERHGRLAHAAQSASRGAAKPVALDSIRVGRRRAPRAPSDDRKLRRALRCQPCACARGRSRLSVFLAHRRCAPEKYWSMRYSTRSAPEALAWRASASAESVSRTVIGTQTSVEALVMRRGLHGARDRTGTEGDRRSVVSWACFLMRLPC